MANFSKAMAGRSFPTSPPFARLKFTREISPLDLESPF